MNQVLPNGIVLDDVLHWRLECLSCKQIARKVKCSTSKLWRWRVAVRFQEPLRITPIEEIIEIVRLYILQHKRRGENLLMGHIRGQDHHIWISMRDLRVIINSASLNYIEPFSNSYSNLHPITFII
jgi:hypothetical protein